MQTIGERKSWGKQDKLAGIFIPIHDLAATVYQGISPTGGYLLGSAPGMGKVNARS